MKIWILSVGLLAFVPSFAQHAHQHAHQDAQSDPDARAHARHAHSPYSGMQGRTIKALSDQQIADLRAGKGMSFALAAELNGYPGPAHVLELSTPLGLTDEQSRTTKTLFAQMKAEAIALGERLISSERAIDRLFRERKVDLTSLLNATADAAGIQGELRAVHLKYHLKMMTVLTAEQIAKYNELRGYS